MRRVLGAVVALALLAGCNPKAGGEYIGKWKGMKTETRTMEIERNGESFLVRITEPSFFSGKVETRSIPATLKDGVLQVSLGFGTIPMAIDNASGNLTDGEQQYKRLN